MPEADPITALPALLAHPSIASKNWVYRQYDHMVRAGTCVLPGSDAAVFLVREAEKSSPRPAIATRSTARSTRARARGSRWPKPRGISHAAARDPLAVTDNLNFGNPYKPENFWQLRECVEGLAEACREFGTPVTGGNVSLYNQSPAGAIDPTPTVGMVGMIEKASHITTQPFKSAGDAILLLGEPGGGLGGSHFVKVIHGRKAGTPPRLDYAREKAVQEAVRSLIRMGLGAERARLLRGRPCRRAGGMLHQRTGPGGCGDRPVEFRNSRCGRTALQ